jgi:hypothetical protein
VKRNEKENKVCMMCGGRYKKGYTLKQAVYPFVTKNKSLSGVRTIKSLPEYNKNLCAMCYLVGVMEWTDEGLVYYTKKKKKKSKSSGKDNKQDGKTFLFLPIFDNLIELNKFKEETLRAGMLKISGRDGNLLRNPNSEDVEKTFGKYTTLLAFYEKFVLNVKESEVLCNSWGVLHIPLGRVKNVKFETINVDKGILEVISELIENEYLIYNNMIKEVYFKKKTDEGFTPDWDITEEIRENLAESLLTDDFRMFSTQLMPRKKGVVVLSSDAYEVLDELIYLWRLVNMGIPKEKLSMIKSVGNIIAKVSFSNVSLLYKLDRARTIGEFWSVLREISRKLVGMESEDIKGMRLSALDEIIVMVKECEESWKEIRDLLVVYSSVYFALEKLRKEEEKNRKEGVKNEK